MGIDRIMPQSDMEADENYFRNSSVHPFLVKTKYLKNVSTRRPHLEFGPEIQG